MLGAVASRTAHQAHLPLALHLRRLVAAAEPPPGPPQPGLKPCRPLLLAPPPPSHRTPPRFCTLHVTQPLLPSQHPPCLSCASWPVCEQPPPGSSQFLSPKLFRSVKPSETEVRYRARLGVPNLAESSHDMGWPVSGHQPRGPSPAAGPAPRSSRLRALLTLPWRCSSCSRAGCLQHGAPARSPPPATPGAEEELSAAAGLPSFPLWRRPKDVPAALDRAPTS